MKFVGGGVDRHSTQESCRWGGRGGEGRKVVGGEGGEGGGLIDTQLRKVVGGEGGEGGKL